MKTYMIYCLLLFWGWSSNGVRLPFIVILICISLMVSDAELPFMCVLAIWIFSFVRCLIKILTIFHWHLPLSVCVILYFTRCSLFKKIIFFFWPHHTTRGILVPWPGIQPGTLAVGVQSPSHWTAREFPWNSLDLSIFFFCTYHFTFFLNF